MYQIDFGHPIHIHFIGIGGISMSGLAAILLKEGFQVSGSDSRQSELTDALERKGAHIVFGQAAGNIPSDCDLVVYTAAIHPDNPEFAAAVAREIPMLTRAQLLGQIMRNYEMPIAVSGTHGKTTTTSMLSHIAMQAGLDPTISVGGLLQSIGGNIRVGHSQTFITEACEYTNSFLSFFPKLSLILNVDADHLDFFKDIDDIRHSFAAFARLLPADGALVINGGSDKIEEMTDGLPCAVITYDTPGSDWTASDIRFDDLGFASFDAMYQGTCFGRFQLKVPGMHNVSNALASIAAAHWLGISAGDIRSGLASFTGTDRRFQKKGTFHSVTVIDDYAHHPTEIEATLRAARNYPHRRIICAFQPHTYTRTSALLDEFASALSLADEVVLADIYAAREINTLGITSDALRQKLAALGSKVSYFPSFDQIETYLAGICQEGDLLITMGAGDIYRIGEHLIESEGTADTDK